MKTVIEMALEAGLIDFRDPLSAEYTKAVLEDLTGFAELIRADERNSWPAEMEAMERQVNILTDALAEARADEREACAKVCEELVPDMSRTANDASVWDVATFDCATAIRARGQA